MRLVQFELSGGKRSLATVTGDSLQLIGGVDSTYELARRAIAKDQGLADCARSLLTETRVSYAEVASENRLLLPLDHPDPAHLLVSGTGLTHLASAATRDGMHRERDNQAEVDSPSPPAGEPPTDSRALFELGLAQGKPPDGSIGVQPEWFFKGNGHCLVRPGHPLRVPDFSLDAGEEPEVAGLYLVGDDGTPHRLGFALGNELSDHVTEAQNYLYLAHSKLRPCSIGPELVTGPLPQRLSGESRIRRGESVLWSKPFQSGEANMSHRISGLEHHHFKYRQFRQPGSVHVHFFGTATLSFADGVRTRSGDVFEIDCPALGRPLSNPLQTEAVTPPRVHPL